VVVGVDRWESFEVLNLTTRTVLAQVLRWRLRISFQGELRCFSPLILLQSLLIVRNSLLHDGKLLLQRIVLRNQSMFW
jgi:hypothetical protein